MVSTTGGRRPSSPRAWRSERVKAVPLLSKGVSRSAWPRRCESSFEGGEVEDVVDIKPPRNIQDEFGARQEGGLSSKKSHRRNCQPIILGPGDEDIAGSRTATLECALPRRNAMQPCGFVAKSVEQQADCPRHERDSEDADESTSHNTADCGDDF